MLFRGKSSFPSVRTVINNCTGHYIGEIIDEFSTISAQVKVRRSNVGTRRVNTFFEGIDVRGFRDHRGTPGSGAPTIPLYARKEIERRRPHRLSSAPRAGEAACRPKGLPNAVRGLDLPAGQSLLSGK